MHINSGILFLFVEYIEPKLENLAQDQLKNVTHAYYLVLVNEYLISNLGVLNPDLVVSGLAVLLVSIFLLNSCKTYLSKTELIATDDSAFKTAIEQFPSFRTGYRPTIWGFQSIASTLLAVTIRNCLKHSYRREILKTPDSGQLALDWNNENCAKHKLVLLILPGINGSTYNSAHVSHYVSKAKDLDCISVVMNNRGIEADMLTLKVNSYSNDDDIELIVQHIKNNYPEHRVFAIGLSLGGTQLANYLANRKSTHIAHAMIVSALLNIKSSAYELEKFQYAFLNKLITDAIISQVEKHRKIFEKDKNFDLNRITSCRTLREFDTHFTMKGCGYDSVDKYYEDCSIDSKIEYIRTQTLFLNAEDDMFSPGKAFPLEKISSNPHTALIMTRYGSHASHIEGFIPTGCNYACRLLSDYLKYALTDIEKQ